MDVCLSNAGKRTAAAHICKIAVRTIPRCGTATLILLSLGLYFLFPASQTFRQIQTEKNTPYVLTAAADSSSIDLNTLLQIEGVARISPVRNLNASLSLEEYKLDCEIKAVYSSFLSLTFSQGTMYPDSSNMPYLILNKAAAKSFSQEDRTITVSPEDTVILNADGTDRKATVCGIFDDGSEVPAVYMSYDVAQKGYGHNGETGLILLLENKGAAEDAVSALRRHNIQASFDPNLTWAWDLLQAQFWQTAMLSIGLLVCAASRICEKRAAETVKARSERAMLLLSGMTADAVERVFPLRMTGTCTACVLAAALISAIMGTFSLIAVGMGILVACVMEAVAWY